MKVRFVLLALLLAAFAISAAADSFTYSFNATSHSGAAVTGTFVMDSNNQITTFSFDFSKLVGTPADFGSFGASMQQIDAADGYTVSNSNGCVIGNNINGILSYSIQSFNGVCNGQGPGNGDPNVPTSIILNLVSIPGGFALNTNQGSQSSFSEVYGPLQDNQFGVRLTGTAELTTPEPGSILLLGSGLIGGLGVIRRKPTA